MSKHKEGRQGMKRFLQITLLAALMLVLILGTVPLVKAGIPPIVMPNVGWNTGTSWEMPEAAPLAFTGMRPFVGWNT